jgi:hypothetical protein
VVQEPDAGVVLVLLEGHCVVRGGSGQSERRKGSISDLAKRRDTRGVTRERKRGLVARARFRVLNSER